MYKKCSIEGCTNPVLARNWCIKHYRRWENHGNPMGGRIFNGSGIKWLNEHINYSEKGCLIWPFSNNTSGYGHVVFKGKLKLVHKIMCELVNGPPPTPKHVARHLCGNGHLSCVNPTHLAWGTRKDDQKDKVRHGTIPRGEQVKRGKLTEIEVKQIRILLKTLTQKKIAKKFNVSNVCINYIKNNKSWVWLK